MKGGGRREGERGRIFKDKVLVLDAENRSSLAVIRALGRAGIEVIAGSSRNEAIGLRSRFVSEICYYSDPSKEPDKFVENILALVRENKPQMLLPCTDLSLELILNKEEEFRALTCLPFSKQEIIKSILDKSNILKIAASCGIDIPKEINPESASFPVVVKAKKSFNKNIAGFSKPIVKYADSKQELDKILAEFNEPVIIQEKISGPGIGVFTLSKQGKVLSTFCHQRLLEKPPSGGVSVLSESISESEAPVAEARKLIEELKLDGIAMLEFKKHSNGKFYLMEINPRFWGSLQLAIACGRNFPLSLYKIFVANEQNLNEKEFTIAHRLRWLLGTLDHLLIRLKREGIKILFGNPLLLFQKKTSYDVFDLDDIGPFIRELRNYL